MQQEQAEGSSLFARKELAKPPSHQSLVIDLFNEDYYGCRGIHKHIPGTDWRFLDLFFQNLARTGRAFASMDALIECLETAAKFPEDAVKNAMSDMRGRLGVICGHVITIPPFLTATQRYVMTNYDDCVIFSQYGIAVMPTLNMQEYLTILDEFER